MTTPEEIAALRADTRPLNDGVVGSFCDHNEAFRYANSRCLLSNLARSYLNLHGRFLQEPWTADATVGGQPLQVPAVSDTLAQRTIGDIVETALVDGKASPYNVLIRVSEISSISMLKDHTINRNGKLLSIPFFNVTLRGVEKAFVCIREDSASLIGAKKIPSIGFPSSLWQADPQPASSPTRIATQKFHDDLVIAWAESIKAQRT